MDKCPVCGSEGMAAVPPIQVLLPTLRWERAYDGELRPLSRVEVELPFVYCDCGVVCYKAPEKPENEEATGEDQERFPGRVRPSSHVKEIVKEVKGVVEKITASFPD